MPDFAALDSGYLVALAGDFDGFRQETIDRLGHERFGLLASPAVRRELTAIADGDEDQEIQVLAMKALNSFGVWAVLDWELTDGEDTRSEDVAEMLRVCQIIEGELTLRRVVSEAAVIGCTLLVTERDILNSVNNLTLGFALRRESVKDVVIKSPLQIIESLGPLNGREGT